jgi:hypothetical protein
VDYREMFDYKHLRSFHLGGLGSPDLVLTIERVERGTIDTLEDGERVEKNMPFVFFAGYALPLGLNKTNGASFALMYGKDVRKWIGKRVTLYVTTCTNKTGQMVECIRVRPIVPEGSEETAELLAKPGKKVA